MNEQLSPDQLAKIEARLAAEQRRRIAENALAHYAPYPKQREFHDAGLKNRERLLMAANRFGKTICGAAEMAYHLTGLYPDWWNGRRFDTPVRAWAAGVTNESTRDVVQEKLIGPPFNESAWGTGMIPKAMIGNIATARGLPGMIDTVAVKHISGGHSMLQFKSYERGREKWQGAALEVLWFDEEPSADIFTEGLTRTNETGGLVFVTFTPLQGASEVVLRFLEKDHPDRAIVCATIDDAEHFTAEERQKIIASYRKHELEARTKGVPMMGSGRVFPVSEIVIACERRDIPNHWPRIGGMDFGWDHPFAAVEVAWDRDMDIVYVVRAYRVREATPIQHAAALRPWGKELRWAWPRDGRQETLAGAGQSLAKQYTAQGLTMLYEHAQFDDGSVSVEAGLMDILDRMESGRFKVFSDLHDWFEEFRMYHRKDGKVVKERDDLMSATRYAAMMLRHAKTAAAIRDFNRDIKYPKNIGIA